MTELRPTESKEIIEPGDFVSWRTRPQRNNGYRTVGIVDYIQDGVYYCTTRSYRQVTNKDTGRRYPKKLEDLTLVEKKEKK